MASACTVPSGWEGSYTKKQWHLPSILSLERDAPAPAPPALALKLVNLVSSYMPLALFALLPLSWSLENIRWLVSESVRGPLRGLPHSPAGHNSNKFSQLDVVGTPLSGTGAPGWRAWYGARAFCSSGETSTAEITFSIFNCHTMDV